MVDEKNSDRKEDVPDRKDIASVIPGKNYSLTAFEPTFLVDGLGGDAGRGEKETVCLKPNLQEPANSFLDALEEEGGRVAGSATNKDGAPKLINKILNLTGGGGLASVSFGEIRPPKVDLKVLPSTNLAVMGKVARLDEAEARERRLAAESEVLRRDMGKAYAAVDGATQKAVHGIADSATLLGRLTGWTLAVAGGIVAGIAKATRDEVTGSTIPWLRYKALPWARQNSVLFYDNVLLPSAKAAKNKYESLDQRGKRITQAAGLAALIAGSGAFYLWLNDKDFERVSLRTNGTAVFRYAPSSEDLKFGANPYDVVKKFNDQYEECLVDGRELTIYDLRYNGGDKVFKPESEIEEDYKMKERKRDIYLRLDEGPCVRRLKVRKK